MLIIYNLYNHDYNNDCYSAIFIHQLGHVKPQSSLPTLGVSCLRRNAAQCGGARPRSDVYPKTHGACAWRSELRHDDPWGIVNGMMVDDVVGFSYRKNIQESVFLTLVYGGFKFFFLYN